MKLIIDGRLPCMNDLINANRQNRFKGATLKRKTQEMIAMQLRGQIKNTQFKKKVLVYIKYFEKDERRDEDNVTSGAKFILDAM